MASPRRVRTLPLWVTALSSAACSSSAGVEAASPSVDVASEEASSPNADALGGEAALSFEVPTATGEPKTIHTAFVEAVVDGRPTRLILDSGASDHVFTRTLGFADQELVVDDPGTDHAGASVSTWRLERNATVTISGLASLDIERAIVIDGPPPFAVWGIGGFLSPQLLAQDGYVVVDLMHRTLRRSKAKPSSCPDDLTLIVLDSVVASGDAARLPIVEATFAGVPIRLMLNTGGARFEIDPEVYAGIQGDLVATGKGLSGAAVEGTVGEAGVLTLGAHSLPIDEPVVRPQGDTANAQIGMDYLKSSILWLPTTQQEPVAICM